MRNNGMSKKQRRKAEAKFKQSVNYIREEDLEDAIKSGKAKMNKLENGGSLPQSLITVWGNIKIMFALLNDYYKGNYREIPWTSIAAVVSAMLYFISPIDIIPDFIPIVGYMDDVAVITICMRWVKIDIDKYKEWKKND